MTLLEIFNYFEAYAIAHPLLKHVIDDDANTAFIAANAEEDSADELIKSCARELIMVLIPYEKKMLPVKSEYFTWGKTICFLVIKKCSRSSAKEIITAQSECEEIIDDFITRIIADRTIKLPTVELDTFFAKPVGPISDSRYGYICMFNLEDYFEHWVKPAHWSV
jgi:hypothetical protein